MKITPKQMETERFKVEVAYQGSKGLTHIIFSDDRGMSACTFTHLQRNQLISWLALINDADLLPGETPCDECKGTGIGMRLADGELWECRTCHGSGIRIFPVVAEPMKDEVAF